MELISNDLIVYVFSQKSHLHILNHVCRRTRGNNTAVYTPQDGDSPDLFIAKYHLPFLRSITVPRKLGTTTTKQTSRKLTFISCTLCSNATKNVHHNNCKISVTNDFQYCGYILEYIHVEFIKSRSSFCTCVYTRSDERTEQSSRMEVGAGGTHSTGTIRYMLGRKNEKCILYSNGLETMIWNYLYGVEKKNTNV